MALDWSLTSPSQRKHGRKNKTMDFKKYTIKSQEAIQKAAEIAVGNQQQAIRPGHILKAILLSDKNVLSFLIKKLELIGASLIQSWMRLYKDIRK